MELKKCPFCGGEMYMVYKSKEEAFFVYHKDGDHAMLCPVIEPFMLDGISLADAADSWNMRADNGSK